MYCINCGAQISDQAVFCHVCGAEQGAASAPSAADNNMYQQNDGNFGYGELGKTQSMNTPEKEEDYWERAQLIGYSQVINNPEFIAGLKKMKRSLIMTAIFIIPLPFIGFTIYGLVSRNAEFGESLKIGLGVSGIFLVFYLIFGLLSMGGKKEWDGVVVDKKEECYKVRDRSSDRRHAYRYSYYDITFIRKDNGKIHKVTESSPGKAYNYLKVGERLRYHPKLFFPYEKYDKSHDKYIYCAICQYGEKIKEDRCSRCGNLLLK